MVIAAANTGKARTNKIAVKKIDQTNNGIRLQCKPIARMLIIVAIKFIAPNKDETPAKWRLKITQSTDGLLCPIKLLRGGYKVQPVPAPPSTHVEIRNSTKAGNNNQKLKLFRRGNAISGDPNMLGTSQFPKAPISIGMAAKNIITIPWDVTMALYKW